MIGVIVITIISVTGTIFQILILTHAYFVLSKEFYHFYINAHLFFHILILTIP